MEKNYILDQTKKIKTFSKFKNGGATALFIIGGMFFFFGLMMFIIGQTANNTSDGFDKIGLIIMCTALVFIIIGILLTLKYKKKKNIELDIIKKGQLSLASLYDFHYRHYTTRTKNSTTHHYEYKFNYKFKKQNSLEQTGDFKYTFNYDINLKETDHILVCYDENESVVLSSYSLIETDTTLNSVFTQELNNILNEEVFISDIKKHDNLSGETFKEEELKNITLPKQEIKTANTIIIVLAIISVFILGACSIFVYPRITSKEPIYIVLTVISVMILLTLCLIIRHFHINIKAKAIVKADKIKNCLFTYANIGYHNALYSIKNRNITYMTLYYIDKYGNKQEKRYIHDKKINNKDTVIIAYNDTECIPFFSKY